MDRPPRPAPTLIPRLAPEGAAAKVPGWAVIGIFLIMLIQFIVLASAFLMPVTLAFLLFFVFAPFRRMLGRIGIGASVSAAVVTLGMVVLVVGLGFSVSGPISDILESSDEITARLETRLAGIRQSVAPLQEAAEKIDDVTGADEAELVATTDSADGQLVEASADGSARRPDAEDEGTDIRVKVDAEERSTLLTVIQTGPSVAGQVVFTLILLYFLLASGDLLYLKVVQSFPSLGEKRSAYRALREIETALGSYLGAITLINAGLGICIGVAMYLWDMPQPLLWGLAGFILNYIPYIGAISGVAAASVVALITFEDLLTPILVAVTYFSLTSFEGQFVTPYFVSRRLQLNTVVVFVTVALWAWLWSVLGMVVAVPMLVVLKVLSDHVPGLETVGIFLSGDVPFDVAPDEAGEGSARAAGDGAGSG